MILVSDKAHVRTIMLNRPDAMNAFNGALFDSLTEGLLEAGEDSNEGCCSDRKRQSVLHRSGFK